MMSEAAKTKLARAFSIGGHPMILLPVCAAMASIATGNYARIWSILAVTALLCTGLGVWTHRKVGNGQWAHVDAIDPRERREWNRVVLACFFVSAGVCALFDQQFAAGLFALCAIMLCAILFAPWFKLSQHTAFAALSVWVAAVIQPIAGAVFAVICLGVAWSRLHLKRHSPREVIAGFACGSLAGGGLLTLIAKGPLSAP